MENIMQRNGFNKVYYEIEDYERVIRELQILSIEKLKKKLKSKDEKMLKLYKVLQDLYPEEKITVLFGINGFWECTGLNDLPSDQVRYIDRITKSTEIIDILKSYINQTKDKKND